MAEIKFDTTGEDEDLSLGDIVKFLTDYLGKILAFSALGAVLGGGYGLLSTPMFEATGNIQVAKVVNVELESPALLLSKLAMPSFYSEDTISACGVPNQKNKRDIFIKKIKPALIKSSPIITISVKHTAPELGKQCLDSVLKDIRADQSELMNTVIKVHQEQLRILRQELLIADNLFKNLQENEFRKGHKFDPNEEKVAVTTYSSLVSTIRKLEIEGIRARANDIEIQLSPPRTGESNFVAPNYASDMPVNPSLLLLALASALGACVLSIIFILIKNSLRRTTL
jgi:hypothetical protein